MRQIIKVKWIGAGLVFCSFILMIYLLIPFAGNGSTGKSTTGVGVFELSSGDVFLPQNDFSRLFSKMGLSYSSFETDGKEELLSMLDKKANELGLQKIILLSSGKGSEPLLNIAKAWEKTAGVILLSPEWENSDTLLLFGSKSPNVPVGIFDGSNKTAISIYEILSGEDATLLPGYISGGFLSDTTYIAPSGDRFLAKWEMIENESLLRVFLPFFPQVQLSISGFISSFILTSHTLSEQDCRGFLLEIHGAKVLLITFFIAGVFLFLAGVVRPSSVRKTDISEISRDSRFEEAVQKKEKKMFLLSFVFTLFLLILLAVLFLLKKEQLMAFTLSLVPFFYCLSRILPDRKNLLTAFRSTSKHRFKNKEMLPFLLLFLLSAFLMRRLSIFSVQLVTGVESVLSFVFLGIILSISVFFWLLSESLWEQKRREEGIVEKKNTFREASVLLFLIPYVLCIGSGIFSKNGVLLILGLELFFFFFLFLWLKRTLKNIRISPIFVAILTALFYTVFIFG